MNSAASLFSQDFGNLQIVMAFALVFLAITISKLLKLGLELDFFIASVRTTVQLVGIGFILRWILDSESVGINLFILFIMSLVAAQAVTSRLKNKTWKSFLAAFAALVGSVGILGTLSLIIFFQPEAFKNTAFFIPFMGVLMGNALSAISLTFVGVERVRTENLLEIETFKALGASSFEACQRLYRDLLKHALTPILNGMTVVGLVSLPGVMAGQLIGGVDPLVAARFQILVMFLILLTAMVGSLAGVALNHFLFMPSWLHLRETPWILERAEGEKLILSAPSGAGKSRLLKSLVGLDLASIRESVLWSPQLRPVKTHSLKVHYVHQRPYFMPGTVVENLRHPFSFATAIDNTSTGIAAKTFDQHKANALIVQFGLSLEILQKDAYTLSGGEAQILHLIRTLLLEPDILFLDEPTASLDPLRSALLEVYFSQWVLGQNRHLLMITHDKHQAERFGSKIILLKDRQLIYA